MNYYNILLYITYYYKGLLMVTMGLGLTVNHRSATKYWGDTTHLINCNRCTIQETLLRKYRWNRSVRVGLCPTSFFLIRCPWYVKSIHENIRTYYVSVTSCKLSFNQCNKEQRGVYFRPCNTVK